jgi:transcriptional regulator with XRE-family HTH domain
MKNIQIIGQRIKHYRRIKDLTQRELAVHIGVASSFIANIEQGQKGVSLDKLVDICRYLDIGLSDLFPMENRDTARAKEEMIGEIVGALRSLETEQVKMLKTMLAGFASVS